MAIGNLPKKMSKPYSNYTHYEYPEDDFVDYPTESFFDTIDRVCNKT